MSVLRRNIVIIVMILLPIIASVVAFFTISKPDLNLLDTSVYDVFPLIDNTSGGASEAKVTADNGSAKLEFKLDKDFDYPFAGIGFKKKDNTNLDIDGYVLNVKMVGKEEIRMSVRMQKEVHTKEYGDLSAILVKSFAVSPSDPNIKLNIKDVNVIPDWWFTQNPQVNRDIEISEFNSISYIWILTECITPRDKVFTFNFESASLSYDYTNFFYGLLWSLLAYIFLCLVGIFVWKKRITKTEKEYVYMRVEKTDIVNASEELTQRLLDYIGHNYHNPEIKLGDVAVELGITEDKALDLLKSTVDMTFRSYLNGLRIEEAKRLLQDSEYQISEIAFKVGYNNVQHFNRVFKEITGDTPRGFREK